MTITQLTAQNFRNLTHIDITPSPTINVFFGENAAGKTSLLEVIYYLSMGRSFRTRLLPRIIQKDTDTFTLFAAITRDHTTITLGLERTHTGGRRLHVNGEPKTSQSIAVKHLPLLFMSANSCRYFYDGPKARRSFLDWGVFHVKHRFHTVWQSFQKVLKQRNEALRQQLARPQIQIWDIEFTRLAEEIDQWRFEYVSQLSPLLDNLLQELNSQIHQPLILRYERGWSNDKNLSDVLASNWAQDMRLGYTQAGPQRADLTLYLGNVPAQDILSQGQQKQVAYSLYLAQGMLFKQVNAYNPIYLIDDLPAELDIHKRTSIARILIALKAQVFVTGINQSNLIDLFLGSDTYMFHVKHGGVTIQS